MKCSPTGKARETLSDGLPEAKPRTEDYSLSDRTRSPLVCGKTPRAICLDLLAQFEGAGRHPDQLLNDSFKQYPHLTPLDRAFLTELMYGILRWKGRIDWIILHFSKIPFEKIELEILNILRLGIYQILFLSKTPSFAATNESVEEAKKIRGRGGAGFVNAVLRSILRKKEEIPYPKINEDPALSVSIFQAHPLWLVQRWIEEMGVEETLKVCEANNRIPPLVLRVNTLRIGRVELIDRLKKMGLEPSSTLFSEEGLLIQDPPPVSELPYLNKGLYIIQDEASQMVTSILDPKPEEILLDACAAPGGKTTHIAQRMENKGEIYALDISKAKLSRIEKLCHRLGIDIVKTIKGDAAKPLPVLVGLKFDRILADVPCSGFGTLRRNPDLKWRKGEKDIGRLSQLQISILNNLSGYVKEGGIMVYSTCTVFREENEDVITKFLDDHPEFQLDSPHEFLPAKNRSLIRNGYFKTFPQREEMDGFFVARLHKLKGTPHPPLSPKRLCRNPLFPLRQAQGERLGIEF